MFTGIVRELGHLERIEKIDGGARLSIDAPLTAEGLQVGDSVALNGCCLTVTDIKGSHLTFTAVPETIQHTSLGQLVTGSRINLEPALRVGDAMGGHIVQGHVDGLGEIAALEPEGEGRRMTVAASDDVLRYCVYKGSVAIDGISLTIAALHSNEFEIALIPHTLDVTTLGHRNPGDKVNIEVDVLAKHVERLTAAYRDSGSS